MISARTPLREPKGIAPQILNPIVKRYRVTEGRDLFLIFFLLSMRG